MSGYGKAGKVHVVGTSGHIANVSSGNALKTEASNRRHYPLGVIRTNAVAPTRLPNCPCSVVWIRNLEGNLPIWVGGSDEYSALAGVTAVMYETEMLPFPVSNANELSIIASVKNTDVLVSAFSNEDIDYNMSNPGPPDITPPTVASKFPNDATGIATNIKIYAIFDEEIKDETITTANITIAPAVPYTVAKDSINPNKISVIPDSNLAFSTTYTITYGTGLSDAEDNFMAAPFSWSFTTDSAPPPPDTTAPSISVTYPLNNAIDIPLSVSPTITFSEKVQTSTVTTDNIKLFKVSDESQIPIVGMTWSSDGLKVTLTVSGLTYSTQYRLDMLPGITDLAGNVRNSTASRTWTTVAQALNQLYTLGGSDEIEMYSGVYTNIIEKVDTSSSYLYNQKLRKISFEAARYGSPTGNITVLITDSSGNVKHTFSETKDVSSLGTSYGTVTLNSPLNEVKMAVGYRVVIRYTGGSSSNYVKAKYASSSTYNGTNSTLRLIYAGWNLDYSDADMAATIWGVP